MWPLVWAHTTFETLCNLTLHPTLRCFMHSRYFKISNRSGSKICQDTSPWLRWRLRFPRRAPPVLACLRCTPLGHVGPFQRTETAENGWKTSHMYEKVHVMCLARSLGFCRFAAFKNILFYYQTPLCFCSYTSRTRDDDLHLIISRNTMKRLNT